MERPDHSFVQNVVGTNVRKYRLERNWSQQDISMRLKRRKTCICLESFMTCTKPKTNRKSEPHYQNR